MLWLGREGRGEKGKAIEAQVNAKVKGAEKIVDEPKRERRKTEETQNRYTKNDIKEK